MSKSAEYGRRDDPDDGRPGDDHAASSSGRSPTRRTRCATTRPRSRASATCSTSSARPPTRRPPTSPRATRSTAPLKSRRRRRRRRAAGADPGALPGAARGPRRADDAAARPAPPRPAPLPSGDAAAGVRRGRLPAGVTLDESSRAASPATVNATDRRIIALALPALGTLAAEPLYVLADTAIVGHLGTTPLAGLALARNGAGLLVTAGLQLPRLRHHAAPGPPPRRRPRPQGAAAARGGAGAVAVRGCSAWPIASMSHWAGLCRTAGLDPCGRGEVLDVATTYLRISAVGIPFVLVALAGQGALRGYGRTCARPSRSGDRATS